MAQHKNQHFVPKCYFKPFTADGKGVAINLLNIARSKCIPSVPVRGQCAKTYLYGADLKLEKSFQAVEGNYSSIIRALLEGRAITDDEIEFLADFAFFQSRRTEVAVQRMRSTDNVVENAIYSGSLYKRPEVDLSDESLMRDSLDMFLKNKHLITDLKRCLVKNESRREFVISDDPAILTNKYFMQKFHRSDFGVASSGAMIMMPLTPRLFLLCFDGGVYTVPDKQNGHVVIHDEIDVFALNELQYLKSSENIYFFAWDEADAIKSEFEHVRPHRPESWVKVTKMVQVSEGTEGRKFRRATDAEFATARRGMILQSTIYPAPSKWLSAIKFRNPPRTYSDGSGVGLVRKKEYLKA